MPTLTARRRPDPDIVADPGPTLGDDTGYDRFLQLLGSHLGTSLAGAAPETSLADLSWDSLTMLEAQAWLDEQGIDLPDELVASWRTLGDVHHQWMSHTAGGNPATRSRIPTSGNGLAGRLVHLVPVTAAHEEWLHRLHTDGDHLVRYRLRATVPDPAAFHRLLWERTVANFAVVTSEERAVGCVTAFAPDFRNRHAHVAAIADPEWTGTGAVAEGLCVLVSYLFAEFDLRKVYAEVLESNSHAFASGASRAFRVEGRLVAHEYLHGGYEDTLVLAAHRDEWRDVHRRLVGGEPRF